MSKKPAPQSHRSPKRPEKGAPKNARPSLPASAFLPTTRAEADARGWGQLDFVYVTGFPMAKRPFYTHPDPADARFSNGFDLLFRGVELVTGGQRLHRYDDYVAALGGDVEPYAGYLDGFRYGMPPHGGFAIGLERFVARLLGAANVREVTAFPRDLHRLTP